MEYAELTEKIIGCAMKVHQALAPGFLSMILTPACLPAMHARSAAPFARVPAADNGASDQNPIQMQHLRPPASPAHRLP